MTAMSGGQWDRRQWVQAMAGTAALAGWPGLAQASGAPTSGFSNAAVGDDGPVVGVLLPGSSDLARTPQVAQDFWQGLLAGPDPQAPGGAARHAIRWVPVHYGFAGSHALRAATELLARYRVDALTGFVDGNAALALGPLLQDHGVPLLLADAGASVLQDSPADALVFRHSLGYWQSSWSAGRWAARALGRTAAVAVGPLESGYDMLPAFTRGFESAGGRVLMTGFTHRASGESRLVELHQAARASGADFVFALDSGRQGQALLDHWQHVGAYRDLPLVAGGALASQALARGQAAPAGLWAVGVWPDTQVSAVQRLGSASAQALAKAWTTAQIHGVSMAQALADARGSLPHGNAGFTLQGEAPVRSLAVQVRSRTTAVALPPAPLAVCDGLCAALGSRCTTPYLAA